MAQETLVFFTFDQKDGLLFMTISIFKERTIERWWLDTNFQSVEVYLCRPQRSNAS